MLGGATTAQPASIASPAPSEPNGLSGPASAAQVSEGDTGAEITEESNAPAVDEN